MCWFAPAGFFMCFNKRTDAKYFLALFAATAYFFSLKMVRLIILMGPITAALAGMALAAGGEWAIAQAFIGVDEDDTAEDDKKTKRSEPKKKCA